MGVKSARREARDSVRKQKREARRVDSVRHAFAARDPIEALTLAQKVLIEAIEEFDQVFAIGPAGTGKTFIPSTAAIDAMMDGDVDKIILCRPAVEVDEKHGFIPGDLKEKLAPWSRPFIDVMSERVGNQKIQDLIRFNKIEVIPFSHMRGLTFKRAWVIVDEAQNITPRQMKMLLTRIGDDCRLIVNGDLTQKDRPGVSGLEVAIDIAERFRVDAKIVRFDEGDVVRSGICKQWTDGYRELENGDV